MPQADQVLCSITKVYINGATSFLMRHFEVNTPLSVQYNLT